ncbi:MAG: hypothetical protein JO276_13760 [Sphingomonadaceae bacterium]|nr:hypothetical protein [Sphingomonadaceae bacterium]
MAPMLAALLLAATPALPSDITDRSDPEGRAVNCAAYLGHEINAVPRAARPPLIAAMRAWRADLERRRTKDEADQYFASTFAVLRDTPPRTRRAAAAYCRAHAPGRRR